MERDERATEQRRHDDAEVGQADVTSEEHETHATMGGAAAAGAVTGGVIGLTGGPIGAALGAVGGAIVGAAAERMMHSEDETPQAPINAAPTSTEDISKRDTASTTCEHETRST